MKKLLLFSCLALLLTSALYGQRKEMESGLLLGYERYTFGFVNVGYSALFEHESLYRFTRRSRFAASALFNPGRSLYGLQVGGSYSYLFSAGMHLNIIKNIPLWRSWQVNINPRVGLDFWWASLEVGYNFQVELQPPLTPPAPPLGRFNLTANIYWPLKRNKRMYR